MKKIFRVVLVGIFFCSYGIGSSSALQEFFAPSPGVTISMDLKDAGLKDILKILSIQSGMNFIASEAVQNRLITLYMDKVPLEEAMNQIFSANNLTYVLNKEGNIFLVKDWGKPMVETVTKVFYLKHATVSSSSLKEEMKNNMGSSSTATSTSSSSTGGKWTAEDDAGITKAVKKLLTPIGFLIEDFRTNSLVVTDVPSRMPAIEQVVKALDISVPQVMLEVEILDVNKNVVDTIGFKFGQTPFSVALTGGTVGVGFPFKGWNKMFSANPAGTTLGGLTINSSPYTMALDFLRTQTDTKYLARPRILTLNNETAEIKITTNETIGVITTTLGQGSASDTTTSAERAETGVSLRVTPQIDLETGEITMFVMPTVKDTVISTIPIGASAESGVAKYKDPEERSTKSTVRVKDGETVIMGGLLRNQRSDVVTKLPFLGDIPLLGALFRHRETSPNRERELLVFITPHIVKDRSKAELAQTKANLFAEREQDVISGGERQAIIASSLDKFENKYR
jgi:type II secretory pathway component GspD/PulD (secretin)